jgi:hypothetical protein
MVRPVDFNANLGSLLYARFSILVRQGSFAGSIIASYNEVTTDFIVDSVASFWNVLPPIGAWQGCRVALTANVTIASPGATLDGVAMAVGDRVLLTGQSTTTENGPYIWRGAALPMCRSGEFHCNQATGPSSMYRYVSGTTIAITSGTYAGQNFQCSTTGLVRPGGSATAWAVLAPLAAPLADISLAGRNWAMNGNFDVDQRNANTAQAPIANAGKFCDRWSYYKAGGGGHSAQISAGNVPTYAQSGINSSYRLVTSCSTIQAGFGAADYYSIEHAVYIGNPATYKVPFLGRVMTLTFWVQATRTGISCVSFTNRVDRSYVAEFTINQANTWETITFTMHDGLTGSWNSQQFTIRFSLGAGANAQTTANAWQVGDFRCTSNQVNHLATAANNFIISQVDFRVGPATGPGQFNDFSTELQRCKAFYQKTFPYATLPAQNAGVSGALIMAQAVGASTAVSTGFINRHEVEMIGTPTGVTYNPSAANAQARNINTGTDCTATSFAGSGLDTKGAVVNYTTPAGSAATQQLKVHITLDAEVS